MIALPDVTLFLIDGGVCRGLFKRALFKTLLQIDPARILIFSCEPHEWSGIPAWNSVETIEIPHCRSSEEAMRVQWYTVPAHIKTTHMLAIEWDGWVLDGDQWTDEYLNYDYIGAPWPWLPEGQNIGNGLGLRSTDLMRFLSKHEADYPFPHPEDVGIGRTYRPCLERLGFKYPPTALAQRFSWERGERPGPTFMFHGLFNWPHILTEREIAALMVHFDDYVWGRSDYPELIGAMAQKRKAHV